MKEKLLFGMALLLLVPLLIVGCATGVSQEEYNKVKSDLDTAQSDIGTLQAEIDSLETMLDATEAAREAVEANVSILEVEIDILETQLDATEAEREAAEANVSVIEVELDALQTDYDSLEASYNELSTERQISEVLTIGHLLADYYNEVREVNSDEPGGLLGWLFGSITLQEKVDFCANLAKHGLGLIYWVAFEDTYYSLADEHSYTTARDRLDRVLNVIGTQVTDSPTEKVAKILEFISTYVHYEHDFNEAFLAPIETLGFRSGDCDDFAVLAATLFEAVGVDSAIGFFESEGSYHAMVLVHLDSISPYGYYYYSDLTSFGLQSGKWIEIEPQTTIDNQLTDWVHKWSIKVVAEV